MCDLSREPESVKTTTTYVDVSHDTIRATIIRTADGTVSAETVVLTSQQARELAADLVRAADRADTDAHQSGITFQI
jgi:hypothetical protein